MATKDFVFVVTVTASEDSNGAEMGTILESAVNQALGGEAENITVEEEGSDSPEKPQDPLSGAVNSPDTDSAAPDFVKEPWVKEETDKTRQREKKFAQEVQAVNEKTFQAMLDEEMDTIPDDMLPAHIQFSSNLVKTKYKLKIAEIRVAERMGA